MNIFFLDDDIKKCAEYHCDKHVVKMILEYAQLLCTALHFYKIDAPYRATHKNHPCSIWVKQSLSNWIFLYKLCQSLNDEYMYRYDRIIPHKSYLTIKDLRQKAVFNDIGLTEPAQAMPDDCKMTNNAVLAYRKYYIQYKKHILNYTKRQMPYWIIF